MNETPPLARINLSSKRARSFVVNALPPRYVVDLYQTQQHRKCGVFSHVRRSGRACASAQKASGRHMLTGGEVRTRYQMMNLLASPCRFRRRRLNAGRRAERGDDVYYMDGRPPTVRPLFYREQVHKRLDISRIRQNPILYVISQADISNSQVSNASRRSPNSNNNNDSRAVYNWNAAAALSLAPFEELGINNMDERSSYCTINNVRTF